MDTEQLQCRRDDLLAMATAVAKQGWNDYQNVWSAGEVAGVALVLGDLNQLAQQSETESSALDRWAFDLWGLNIGEVEVGSGCPRTREFFESLSAAFRADGRKPTVMTAADVNAYAQKVYEANREAGY